MLSVQILGHKMCSLGLLIAGYFVVFVTSDMHTQAADAPVVHTDIGDIVGKSTDVRIKDRTYTVHTFRGIPYAEPPIGNLRFRKPVSIKQFSKTPWNASDFGSICQQPFLFQYKVVGERSEDCLFLNVYEPRQPADQPSGHAVMVYIHGGSLLVGSSNMYDATHLAAYGNVVVVTFNYRLGPLGFLSTGDKNCPGNFGLWDQRLVFKWVQENIYKFNGDPNRVTIFGNSAGGMSVVIHGMSPSVNKNLFQRIIAQSGVPYSDLMVLNRNVLALATEIAKFSGCIAGQESDKIIDCLRGKTWSEILYAMRIVFTKRRSENQQTNFDPVIDNDFIKLHLKDLHLKVQRSNSDEISFFQSLDFITGVTAYEGSVFVPFYMQSPRETLISGIQTATNEVRHHIYSSEISKTIGFVYTDWNNPNDQQTIDRVQLATLYGDLGFGVPAVNTSRLHAINNIQSNTYAYQFLPVASLRSASVSWLPGAVHEEELAFVFGMTLGRDSNLSSWEEELTYITMTYWSNFAKSGDPNKPEGLAPMWLPYTVADQHYMALDRDMDAQSCRQYLLADKTHFWEEIIPALTQKCGHTNGCDSLRLQETCGSLLMLLSLVLLSAY